MNEATKQRLRRLLALVGYEVHRRDHSHEARRVAAMKGHAIDVVLDVGANSGQYAAELREFGYTDRIVSVEPLPAVFAMLAAQHGSDPRWSGERVAVGAERGELVLHVSESTLLSSALPTTDLLRRRISSAQVRESVSVEMVTLDQLASKYVDDHDRLMIKIDVQGYEHPVLDGGAAALDRAQMVEIEMALTPLYEGGSTIHDLLPRMREAGFEPFSLHRGYADPRTGQMLDVEVLFTKSR